MPFLNLHTFLGASAWQPNKRAVEEGERRDPYSASVRVDSRRVALSM
jgi:hypothetical protein